MITKYDLLASEAALDELAARQALDAKHEASAPTPSVDDPTIKGSTAALASAAVTLSSLLDLLRDTRAQVEEQIYAAVCDAQITLTSDQLYDQLRAIQQECSRLNDCAYKLWLSHACESLKH